MADRMIDAALSGTVVSQSARTVAVQGVGACEGVEDGKRKDCRNRREPLQGNYGTVK